MTAQISIGSTNIPLAYQEIPGLTYKASAIDPAYEEKLVAWIDSQPWQNSLNRQVQHYGVHYDYQTRRLSGVITKVPAVLMGLAEALGLPDPDNIIINKYEPGQGIAPHVDSGVFGEVIASLSLKSAITMDLKRGNVEHGIRLEPRSLLKLTGESRTQWTHGITARKSDLVDRRRIPRNVRYSITFRTIAM